MKTRIAAEGKNASAASRQLWDGLVRFNRATAGPLRYTRTGFPRFGGMEGSPAGASRHFYAKRLTRS